MPMAKAKRRKPMAEINVVPYIDVMLVLLIIFMVTAPMLVQSISVDLPDVDAQPSDANLEDNTLIVSVDKSGTYFIQKDDESESMSLANLTTYISKTYQANPKLNILIRGDEAVPYGYVVELMGSIQAQGVSRVGLVTEAPDPEASP